MKYVKLDEIAEFINGYAFKPSDWGAEGHKIIRIQNLTDPNKPFNRTKKTVPEKYIVQKGDLLISWSATLGIFEWLLEEDALLNQHIFKVVLDTKFVNKKYFMYVIGYTISKMIQFTHGSTMKHIVRGDFLNHEIPLPTLQEQEEIIKKLDRADALRQKRVQSINLLDRYIESVFPEMFGDPARNSNNYKEMPLKEISVKITDGEHVTPKRTTTGIKLLSARNVKNGYIDFDAGVDHIPTEEYERIVKRCNPEFGDLLISCSGTIGRVTTVNITEPFTLVRSAALVKPDKEKIEVKYLEYYLRSSYLQNLMLKSVNQSSQANLFLGQINKLPVLVPPIAMQRKFVDVVEKKEILKQKMTTQSKDLDIQFQSLMQRSFN